MSWRERVVHRVARMVGAGPTVVLPRGAGGDPGLQTQGVEQLVAAMRASREGMGGLTTGLSDHEVRRYFYGWQYAAITLLAESVMQTPYMIEVQTGGKWEEAEEAHPVRALFENVNPILTTPELWYYTMLDLGMIGKCYWHTPSNALGEPAEIYPLPGVLKPEIDTTGDAQIITEWIEKRRDQNGLERTIHYEPDEITFLRMPQPGAMLDGMGAMQAAGAPIKLDSKIIEAEWSAMKQGLYPSVLLQIPGSDPKVRQQKLDEFNTRWGGAKETGKAIGVSDSIGVNWPNLRPRDMGFTQGSARTRDQILAVAGRVPRALLGMSEGLPKANVQGMHTIFARWSVQPKLTLLQARINQDLIQKRYDKKVRLRFDSPVPEDKDAERDDAEMHLRTGVRTINEVREERGLDAVEWGDVPLVPAGLAPLGSGGEGEGTAAQALAEAILSALGAPAGLIDVPARAVALAAPEAQAAVPRGFTKKERDEIRLLARDHGFGFEMRMGKHWRKMFRAIGRQFLEGWDALKDEFQSAGLGLIVQARAREIVDEILDPEKMAAYLAEQSEKIYRDGLVLGGGFNAEVISTVADLPWDDGMDAINEYALQFRSGHFASVAETTRAQMTGVMGQAVADGKTWGEMRALAVDEFGKMEASRAANIATTETTKLYGAGGQAFRQTYAIPWKQWVASFVNTRDTHADADGTVVPNNAVFHVGDDAMLWPGSGSSAAENCNCFVDPKTPVMTDGGYRPIGKIVPGDRVLTHAGRYQAVTRTLDPKTYGGDVVKLTLERGGSLTVTPEHRVLTDDGWLPAQDVRADMKLTALATRCATCGELIPQVRGSYVFQHCSRVCANDAKYGKAEAARAACFKKYGPGGYLNHLTEAERAKGQRVYAERYGGGNLAQACRNLLGSALGRASWHGSKLEKSMERFLRKAGRRFVPQHPVGCRRIDFYLPDEKLFVECDGPHFHADKAKERARDVEILLQRPDHRIAHVLYGRTPLVWEFYDLAALNDAHAYEFTGAVVKSVRRWTLRRPRRLYNLAVADDESYVAKGVIVHNCNCTAVPVVDPKNLPVPAKTEGA